MKTNLIILLVGLVLVFSGCGTKTENSETATTESAIAERSAKLKKQRARIEAERQMELDKLLASTPYYEKPDGILVYYKAEVDPAYIGGEKALNRFLKDNLKFPADAEDEGLEGTVYVDFVVSKTGEVSDATATNYTYSETDNQFIMEALRVVNLMPDWAPGSQNGDEVNVKFSLPITFVMR